MKNITHNLFMSTFTHEMRGAYQSNVNQEVIIMGAISLFWEHSKNIAYLNHAMQYARAHRGVRVNAVKAFLKEFTGAVWKKDSFTGGGRKLKELPEEFNKLQSWLDWADVEAKEPAYDHKLFVLSIEKYLTKKQEEAKAHEDNSTAEVIGSMLAMAKSAEA
jgi:hypothetical protein